MKCIAPVLLAALMGVMTTGLAQAQSCASPLTVPAIGPQQHIATGNTCTESNQLGTLCGSFNSPENDVVYRATIENVPTSAITLTTTTPTWDPAILYMTGSCGGGVTCTDVAASNGAGANETMAAPTAAGTYYVVITSSPGTGGCGQYTIDFGRVPVTLQAFSVE
ncbi:hypothetical protein [Tahibacter amnicola]|uniref:Pre-peptidase n=1 Tax=Tahibacter amnicola TaxID=2976241 RepID=A0ABY6BF01_9GAMM|nr:hypothetical protein [Tahibacter amnicola]UXI67685.1 hypothetical protein N4264_23585 [Tahibacter amnicola]